MGTDATKLPQSFQKLIDMLATRVVEPKFSGEIQLHFKQGGLFKATRITKDKKPNGTFVFEYQTIEMT